MGKSPFSIADDNYTSRHYYLDHKTATHLRTLMYLYRCDQNYVNLSHRIKKIVELHVHVHVDYLMLNIHVHVHVAVFVRTVLCLPCGIQCSSF